MAHTHKIGVELIEKNAYQLRFLFNSEDGGQKVLVESIKKFVFKDKQKISLPSMRCIMPYCNLMEDAAIEMATELAQCWFFSDYIHHFKIRDEKARIRIAKIAAEHDMTFLRQIDNYQIEDQGALAMLAKVIAEKHWSYLLDKDFEKLQLQGSHTYAEIGEIVEKQLGPLYRNGIVAMLVGDALYNDPISAQYKGVLADLLHRCGPETWKATFQACMDMLPTERLCTRYIKVAVAISSLIGNRHFSDPTRNGGVHAMGLSQERAVDLFRKILSLSKHMDIRDIHIVAKTLLEVFPSINSSDIDRLIALMFIGSGTPQKNLRNNCLWMLSMYNAGQIDFLKTARTFHCTSLSQLQEDAFIKIFDLKNVPCDFAKKYDQVTQHFRSIESLFLYAGTFFSTQDVAMQNALQEYVISLLDENFKDMRYDLQRNPQLAEVDRQNKGFLALWRQGESIPLNQLTLVDTDQPDDLLLIGDDVGSCLRVSGNPSRNKGLLGVVMNGHTRLLAIKGREGKIKARLLLRLMLDQEQKPVLLMEPAYFDGPSDVLGGYLEQFAIRRAQKLGVALVSATDGEGRVRYPSSISSKGGPAPFEYIDSGGVGPMENGAFSLSNCYLIPQSLLPIR